MTITQNVDASTYLGITPEIRNVVRKYMDKKMSAATVSEDPTRHVHSSKFVTSDLIYYWMTELNIPPEYQKWHLNRLLMLIRISNAEKAKQNPNNKKANKADIARRHHSINEARRAKKRRK
jgi:hypothetical protein